MVTLTLAQIERVEQASKVEGVALVGVTPSEPAGMCPVTLDLFDDRGEPIDVWRVGTAGSAMNAQGVTLS